MSEPQPFSASSASALPSARSAKRPLLTRLAERPWALTALGLALLVLLVLPSAQIKLGASQLNGLIGSYTGSGPHYDVSYRGGTTTVNSSPPTAYSSSTSTSAPGDWGGGAYTYFTSSGGSITCAGQIIADFTWNPGPNNAPAPASGSVIVTETANAYWSGPGSTGDCGLPNPTTPSTTPPSQTATRYSVQGGPSFSVNCTPTASASGVASSPNSPLSANAFVGYVASASPATITLTGPITVNGTLEALTGQPVTATFNCGLPNGANITNYQWDIESLAGASIVGGYAASQASGKTMTVNGFNSPSSSSITFYDGIQDTVVINATVTVKYPDNTTTTLKASAQIAFVKPTVAAPPFQLTEYTRFVQDPHDPSNVMGANEVWSGVKITMPAGFSGGTGCFAQIINSTSRTDTRHTGVPYTQKEQISNGTWIAIPAPCLDTNFSYPYAAQWQVSSTGSGGDQPYFQVAPPLNAGDTGLNDWYHAQGEDHFSTWIMFTPDTQNAADIWVPLGSFDWYWSDMANLNGNSVPPAWQAGSFISSSGSITSSTVWPTWSTYVFSGGAAMHQ